MDTASLVPIAVAFLVMVGGGGVAMVIRDLIISHRREGVSHSPGELVFERQDKIIVSLQQQTAAQSQQIATLGEEIRTLRNSMLQKDEQIIELMASYRAEVRQREELEYELVEERTARQELERKYEALLTEVAQLRAASDAA